MFFFLLYYSFPFNINYICMFQKSSSFVLKICLLEQKIFNVPKYRLEYSLPFSLFPLFVIFILLFVFYNYLIVIPLKELCF